MPYKTPGIGKNKKIKAERMKPIVLMSKGSIDAIRRIGNSVGRSGKDKDNC